jgi:hypothetical protein
MVPFLTSTALTRCSRMSCRARLCLMYRLRPIDGVYRL